MDTEIIYDVIVIGGGASGMMAAGRAAELGKKVLLLEKNSKLGKKLKITGGGRCNITNAENNIRLLLPHYGKAEQFLYSSFNVFGIKETFEFFENKNLPLIIEDRKRVFPESQKAPDVVNVMKKYLRDNKVEIITNAEVKKIVSEENKIQKIITSNKEYLAKSFIIATGGKSHPETGSTGDGFKWLADLGHTIIEPTPTVVPLAVKELWVKELSGTSLDDIKITFFVDNKKSFSKKGRVLMTHFGLSGPMILNSAALVSDLLHEGAVTASIDLFPNQDHKQLDVRLTELFDQNKNKLFKTIIKEFLPAGVAKSLIPMFEIKDAGKKIHSITKLERKKIIHTLKDLPVTILGLMNMNKAVVSDGGLILKEVDAKTMRSKLYDNLYITGDVLNIRRPSGGYSLQLCWTTGFVAGSNC